jgi:hypothetical protein
MRSDRPDVIKDLARIATARACRVRGKKCPAILVVLAIVTALARPGPVVGLWAALATLPRLHKATAAADTGERHHVT